ncbi:MAG: D-glycero-beta-D-manno-heptose 1-phosphate adenylyltransferase [Planctomycetes bacterium]|nr:D-glycero-beta-D-manno-heptose 1-phosphate adenylyltransferase [Planctomycetota bacterium]
MTGGLISIAHAARPVTVGVVGDLILDRYLSGEAERISPEAPIPVLDVSREETRLGGAGNVVSNLLAAEAAVWIGGVVGRDANGEQLLAALAQAGADVAGVVQDEARPTVEKVRLIARSQQVLRFDREDRAPLGGAVEARLVAAIEEAARRCDVFVVSDYAKGTVTPGVLAAVLRAGPKVLVDPKGTDYARYRGAYAITPNRAEAEAATGLRIDGEAALRRAAARLLEVVGAEVVLITLGADGIYCAERGGRTFQVRSEARRVFDVTGAGDTVIALVARYLAAGVLLQDAVRIANAAAGLVVGRLGAVAIPLSDLYRALRDETNEISHKLLRREDAHGLARDLRAKGLRIVFTNGCFDLLHAGHARYLGQARAQGDVLVVAVNDDDSVRRLKGKGRPLVELDDRVAMLAALEAVDFVVPFHEDTPEELIREVTPHVLVKGEDWKDKGIAGREWVEAHGGTVYLAPLLEGRSTSGLLERIRSARE